jgi:hypothetical protein
VHGFGLYPTENPLVEKLVRDLTKTFRDDPRTLRNKTSFKKKRASFDLKEEGSEISVLMRKRETYSKLMYFLGIFRETEGLPLCKILIHGSVTGTMSHEEVYHER